MLRLRALTIDHIPIDSDIEGAPEKFDFAGRTERFVALFVSGGCVVLTGDAPDSDFCIHSWRGAGSLDENLEAVGNPRVQIDWRWTLGRERIVLVNVIWEQCWSGAGWSGVGSGASVNCT
jgi:hypothetical protein